MEANPPVFDVEIQSFQSEVIERSKQAPVLLLFWTDQVAPAAETKAILERLATQSAGKFALGLCDVAQDPTLAQQLRVQGIPSIRAIKDGQIAAQMDGPQGEAALKQFIDQLTMSPGDLVHEQLAHYVAGRDWDGALAVLQEALNEEPNNPALKVEWADILVQQGDLDGARTVLATIPDTVEDRARPAARLELMEEAAAMPAPDAALAAVQADEDDLEARYQAAIALAAQGEAEAALDQAMAILERDREFRDDIGRATMVRIMSLMEKGSEVAKSYRRRMFNFMH